MRDKLGRFKGNSKTKLHCDYCGEEIEVYKHNLKLKHHFCNKECYNHYKREIGLPTVIKPNHKINKGRTPWNKGKTTMVKVNCKYCGESVIKKPSEIKRNGNFCSKECVIEYRKEHRDEYYPDIRYVICKECGKNFTTYHKSQQIFCSNSCKNTWFAKQPEYLEKLRNSKLKYIAETYNNGQPCYPTIGKKESDIIDFYEKALGKEFIRQYRVAGYFIDGYCKELGIALEVDEHYHKNQIEKDNKREGVIKDKLKCTFIRLEVSA